jgi:hypothetical protein
VFAATDTYVDSLSEDDLAKEIEFRAARRRVAFFLGVMCTTAPTTPVRSPPSGAAGTEDRFSNAWHAVGNSGTSGAGDEASGLIGCGAIGRPVARALLAGTAGAHTLTAVLARSARELDGFEVTADVEAFLAGRYDLILETGGPAAFRALVPARSSAARCGR